MLVSLFCRVVEYSTTCHELPEIIFILQDFGAKILNDLNQLGIEAMTKIDTMEQFKQALESLPLDRQRLVASRFVGDVLDITDDATVKQSAETAANSNASAEELMSAYHSAKHATITSGLHSSFKLIDYNKQAKHFVAQACAACLAPYHQGITWRHLAWNVAHYCRMARTCASIDHDETSPDLSSTEEALKKQIQGQFEALQKFIDNEQ